MEIKVEAKVLTTEINTHIVDLKAALSERLGVGWDANNVNFKIYGLIENIQDWVNQQETITD